MNYLNSHQRSAQTLEGVDVDWVKRLGMCHNQVPTARCALDSLTCLVIRLGKYVVSKEGLVTYHEVAAHLTL